MGERINDFCASLQDALLDIEARLHRLRATIKSAPKQGQNALQKQRDHIQQKLALQRQALADARENVRSWLDQQQAEATELVGQCKADYDARRLARRADRAEEYAASAILVAAASIDEAEQAVLEAISARLEAEAMTV
jgi:hypothetical protein